MKKLFASALFLGICYSSFAQKKVNLPPKDTTSAPPPGTVVIVLNPEQVHLLETVIGESTAPYKDVNILLQILRNQQYHPPVAPKDTTTPKVIIPKDTVTKKN